MGEKDTIPLLTYTLIQSHQYGSSASKLQAHIYVLPLCGEYICIKHWTKIKKWGIFTRFVTFVDHAIIFRFFPVEALSVGVRFE
jgi:hypothetical protein